MASNICILDQSDNNVDLSHLALGVIGCSLGLVRACSCGLGILWLAVHWRLLTEVPDDWNTLENFYKSPEGDNADLDEPKKFRIGPEQCCSVNKDLV